LSASESSTLRDCGNCCVLRDSLGGSSALGKIGASDNAVTCGNRSTDARRVRLDGREAASGCSTLRDRDNRRRWPVAATRASTRPDTDRSRLRLPTGERTADSDNDSSDKSETSGNSTARSDILRDACISSRIRDKGAPRLPR
jgi:hypothetical protein